MITPENRKEVSDRIKADVQSQLPESNPYLRNSFLQALIFGVAGRIFAVYRLIQSLIKQLFWDTATGTYLERMASWFGITTLAATQSEGYITLSGTATTVVPLGTSLTNSDGVEIKTQSAETITANSLTVTSLTQTSGIATATFATEHELAPGIETTIAGANETEYNVTVTILTVPTSTTFTYSVDSGASSPATGTITASHDTAYILCQSVLGGEDSNIDAGSRVTLTTPIAGVDNDGFAAFGGLTGGTDEETSEDLRTRFLSRVQNPVSLFNSNAIDTQAKLINGVTRTWVKNVDDTERLLAVSSITRNGDVATLTTSSAHGLSDGEFISVTGANEVAYNVSDSRFIVLSTTKIAYYVAGTPATPATGTIVLSASTVEEGQVKVYFTRDNDTSIIPDAGEVTTVKNKILEIKPAHVSDSDVLVSAPTSVPITVTITNLTPDSEGLKTAIENDLTDYFKTSTELGVDLAQAIIESIVYNSVDTNTGNKVTSFTLNSPASDTTIEYDEIATLGTVTIS